MPLLTVRHLTIQHRSDTLVQDLSFNVGENRCVAIVGESGSGKTLTCKSIMGLLSSNLQSQGEIHFAGQALESLSLHDWSAIRGKRIALIAQDGMSAFNPLYTIGNQMRETLLGRSDLTKSEREALLSDVLERVKLANSQEVLRMYPHQLSGGMLQRVMVAIVLALRPALIIADEPTTALDAVTQSEVIDELRKLNAAMKSSMIIVSHDLGVVKQLADDVIVMQAGKIVEQGSKAQIFSAPQHPYTRYLIDTRRALSHYFRSAMCRAS